jgi:inosine-uridine nucleoside N-ribohydrolase
MIYSKYNFSVPKEKMIRVITDTDAKNEADDQYAIVHTLLSPRFDNRAIIAAHFGEEKSKTSMEDSFREIQTLLQLMNMADEDLAVQGAFQALPDENTPIPSPGAEFIINEAMADDPKPLFITFLGPLTDIASAYLMEPRIAETVTIIWIGGGKYPIGGREYNLSNDIHAANVVFKSNIPVWQVPQDVYRRVMVSFAELESRVKPCGKIGEYLFEQLVKWSHTPYGMRSLYRTGECWCLGDSPAVGLMLNEHEFHYDLIPAPEFSSDMCYTHHTHHPPIRVYNYIDSRFILEDFFLKIKLFTQKKA